MEYPMYSYYKHLIKPIKTEETYNGMRWYYVPAKPLFLISDPDELKEYLLVSPLQRTSQVSRKDIRNILQRF
jgi:hypothetical protein